MSNVEALNKRITFGMFLSGMKDRLKGIMAKSLSAEEKLDLIIAEMTKDTNQKRITAREIRAKMVALADPETAALEPLERIKVQRDKLVKVGASLMKSKEEAEVKGEDVTSINDKINKLAQEVKSLTVQQGSMESTYETLKEAYDVALNNYKTASSALENAKTNGKGLLFAIKAHQDALQLRDNTRTGTGNDASFLKDMEDELGKAQGELRSDKHIEAEIEGSSISSIVEEGNEDILAEFKAAK